MFSNKKASELDLVSIMVILFGFGITISICYTLLNNLQDQNALNQTTQSTAIIDEAVAQYPLFDNLFVAVLLGLSMTSIIAAAFVRTSPLFLVISIILLTIVVAVGGVISNAFETITNDASLSAVAPVFPKMMFIMDHLMLYLIIEGMLIMIALYSVRGSNV